MASARPVARIFTAKPTLEGAGVHLKRAFGYHETQALDPFLLLDDFHSDTPDDYLAGFPWHPHRGIETVSYLLQGSVEHGDSLGNRGVIAAGDVQWMTAGSGIVHQEMPKGDNGGLWGFQLWVNLPRSHKMMAPRYQEVKGASIPVVRVDGGASVRVIAGTAHGVHGPVREVIADPVFLDVTLPPNASYAQLIQPDHTAFAYVIQGRGTFGAQGERMIGQESVVLFGDGDRVAATSEDQGCRFLLVAGKPLREPIAWYGPIVMNTRQELDIAFEEYQKGTFLKH